MNEMSLRQQIKQIDDVMQYILLICDEAEQMEKKVSDTVMFLRKNGLRTETADKIQKIYIRNIDSKLGAMLERMRKEDYEYLAGVKADLEALLMR